MTKFKLTLLSGLVIEHLGYSMVDAIKYIENSYRATVIKAEMIIE